MSDSQSPSVRSDGSGAAGLQIVLPPSRTPSGNSAESAERIIPSLNNMSTSNEKIPDDTEAPALEKMEEIKPSGQSLDRSTPLQKSGKSSTGKSGSAAKSSKKEKISQPPPLILMGPSGLQSSSKWEGQRQSTTTSQQSSVILPPSGPFLLPPHFQSAYFNQQGHQGHQTLIVNHYGQPVGIVSPIMPNGFNGPVVPTVNQNNPSASGQPPTSVSNSSSNPSLMPRGPIMYAYRSSSQPSGNLVGNQILSAPGHLSGFPSTSFPSNTVVIRTPVGQLMGFQVTAGGNIVPTPFLSPSGGGFIPAQSGFNPTYQSNTSSSSTTVTGDGKSGNLPDIPRGVPIFPHPQYPTSSSGAPILPKPAFMSNLSMGIPHQLPPGYGFVKSQPAETITKGPGPSGLVDVKLKNSSSSDYATAQLPKLEFVAANEETTRKSSSSDLDSINVSDSPPPVINIGLDSKRMKDNSREEQDRLDRDSQSSEPPRLTPVNESSAELIVADPGGSSSEPPQLEFDKKWLKHDSAEALWSKSVTSENIYFDPLDRSDLIGSSIDPHTLFMQEVERNCSSKPDVLVHYIDGFIIHESSMPFPVSSFPFDDFVTSAMMELAAPPELELAVTAGGPDAGESQIPPCAHCKRSTANGVYHRFPQFCSKFCYKKSKAAAGQLSPDSYTKRAKLDLSSTKSDISDRSKQTEISSGNLSAQLVKSPSAFSPSSKSAISDASMPSSSSVSTEPPVTQELPAALPAPTNRTPSQWTVDEVFAFLISLGPSVAAYAPMFRQQEIDGQALMLLHENHLMDSMGLKLGPALKLCAAVKDLKSCRL